MLFRSVLSWAYYEIKVDLNQEESVESLEESISKWLKKEEVLITRLKKKGKNKVPTEINIVPLLGNITIKGLDENNYIVINALLRTGEGGNLKPVQLMEAMSRDLNLNLDLDSLLIKRIALYAEKDKNIYCPL